MHNHYRTIWISDVHLGSPSCKAEFLVDFLKYNHCEKLYLVGDIIDGWKLQSRFFLPQSHLNVVRRVLTKAKRGVEIIYVTGNHDEFLRKFTEYELTMGNIRIVEEDIHETADKKKFLVIHGDGFDVVVRYHKWLAFLGDQAYSFLIWVNNYFNRVRHLFGYEYWSISAYMKLKVKRAVNFISHFEELLVRECEKRGLDGVVCGHIHKAEIKDLHGKSYCNSGDWVESCTALVEHAGGEIEIVHWAKRSKTTDHNEDPHYQ